jgi:hypothetical protein
MRSRTTRPIPDDSLKPDGTLCDAAIFYKRLA